jgi:hypothetical protein
LSTGFEGVGVCGEFVAEVGDGGGDDGVVEEGLVAGVGDDEGGVEELAGEAGEAAAGADPQPLAGTVSDVIAEIARGHFSVADPDPFSWSTA